MKQVILTNTVALLLIFHMCMQAAVAKLGQSHGFDVQAAADKKAASELPSLGELPSTICCLLGSPLLHILKHKGIATPACLEIGHNPVSPDRVVCPSVWV